MSGWIDNLNTTTSSEQLDIQKNSIQEQNLTPEEILASIDPNSEYYQQVVEEYDEFEKNKNETFAEQINSSQIALKDLRLEFQQDIEAIKKMDTLFDKFEIDWNKNVVKEKFSKVFANNEALEESFFTLIDTLWEEAVRSYIETRLSNPRRIDDRGIQRMIDGFQEELSEKFESEINSLINSAESSQDIDYIEQKINKLPEEKKEEYKDIFIDLKKKLQDEVIEDNGEVIEDNGEVIEDYIESTLEEEKSNLEKKAENLDLWSNTQELLKNKVDFSDIDEKLQSKYGSLLDEIKSFVDIENISNEDISNISELLLWENSQFKDFLIDLWKTDIEQYAVFYNTFKDIPEFSSFISNLDTPEKLMEIQSANENTLGKSIQEIYAESYLGEDVKRLGDKMYSEDKMVDLWEYPPKYYMVWKSWFKLETTIPISKELDQSRKEYFSMQTRYHEEYNQSNDRLKTLEHERNIKKEAWIDTTDLDFQITEINNQIKEITDKFKQLEIKFKYHIDSYLQEHQSKLKEKDEKVKDVLNLINQIGFNIIPQEIVNNVFSKISESNPVVVGNNIITGLDLNTMDFIGDFNPTLGDGWPNDPNTRNVLIQLMNKMISWNEDIPAVISSYSESWDMQFKTSQDSKETMTREELKWYIANSIWLVGGNPINLIDQNLKSTNSQEK